MEFNSNFSTSFHAQQAVRNFLPCTLVPCQGNNVQTYLIIPLTPSNYQSVQPIQPSLTVTSGTVLTDVPQSTVQQEQQEVQENDDDDDGEKDGLLQMNQMNQMNQNDQRSQPIQFQEVDRIQESPLSHIQTNYNDIASLKFRNKMISQMSLNPKEKKSAKDDVRKSVQKLNRTNFASFLDKLATSIRYRVKFAKPSKQGQKTFCLAYDQIIDPEGNVVWSFEDSIETINHYYNEIGKKRNNIRECAIVVEINVMLFLLEQNGAKITYGKVKKMGFHLLLTTENVLAIELNDEVYTPDEMIEIGKEYYENVIQPQLL